MRTGLRRLAGVGLACALGLAAAPAAAEEEGWSYGLSHELMSPYCPGRTLADCPSEQAADVVEWMVSQERAGRSEEEVRADLYQQFGDVLRSAPKAEGVGLLSYGLPLLAFLGGGIAVAAFLRRQTAAAAREETPSEVDPEALRAIDAELAADEADPRS